MSIFHQARPARTLETLIARFGAGDRAEVWTFDDRAARRAAEEALARKGATVRIRSAYKPLVTFFREEVRPGFSAVRIVYPVHPGAVANRFLLESYPLAALLAPVVPDFVAGDGPGDYRVRLSYPDGIEEHRVFAPNRIVTDMAGEAQLSPCGWLRHEGTDEALETDYEQLFHGVMEAVRRHPWPATEPYFEELNLSLTLPAGDEALGYDDEVLSLREAMHEDLYFSLLEYFGTLSGRPAGDRHLQPGQIVPEIRAGEPSAAVSLRPLATGDRDGAEQDLDTAGEPPSVAQVRRVLDGIGGTAFSARSRAGRTVDARHVAGQGAAVMISAGQHPNETTPVVGALRAALRLKAGGAHFTISPVENPDGYALHGRLVRDNPCHMHHAARYTSFGDDLEYREDPERLFEQAIRRDAEALSGAQLHVNLHGYPSHEWTRPMSGYVPRGFAMWTLPKGFFLVLRHHAGWEDRARALIGAVTRDLGRLPGLLAFNDRQIALYGIHAGETGFEMINGFPCYVSLDPRHRVPLTLITEYPDETIHGAAYVAGHEAQMATVLAAHAAWQALAERG